MWLISNGLNIRAQEALAWTMTAVDDEEAGRRPRGPRTTTEGERCPLCGKSGAWSSLGPEATHTPPPGHTVYRLEGEFEGLTFDVCPLLVGRRNR